MEPESLDLELTLAPRVHVGRPVRFLVRIRNRTDRPLDLYLRGRTPTLDVVVTGPGGEPVWRRLEGETVPAILQLRPLAPNETLEVEAFWDQRSGAGRPVEPGRYSVRGLLLAEGEPLETPAVGFEIAPPPR